MRASRLGKWFILHPESVGGLHVLLCNSSLSVEHRVLYSHLVSLIRFYHLRRGGVRIGYLPYMLPPVDFGLRGP